MEFNTEIAPYASVQTLDTMVIVDVQPASVPLNDSAKLTCEKNPVEVEMYQIFLNEQDFSINSYFTAITSMLTVTDIKENGVKVLTGRFSTPIQWFIYYIAYISETANMEVLSNLILGFGYIVSME